MDPLLEAYKKTEIDKLVSLFNVNVNRLKVNLTNQLNAISRMKINSKLKLNYINFYVSNYNNSMKLLRDKLTNDIKNINLLTVNPIQPQITINYIPVKKALLVGCNYENTPYQLYGCINDTSNIKNILQKHYGYSQFTVLTDNTTNKPTKSNIIKEFTNLLRNSSKGDSLFFMFSGHGTYDTDLNGDEPDGRDELIVPLDYNQYIRDDELNKIIQDNLKPDVKLFALFDCCFSGTVLDLKYNQIDNSITLNNTPDTKGLVCMISGCKDNQTSMDTVVEINKVEMASGAMTFAFIKTIEDKGTNITYKQLVENMRDVLKTNGYSQIPQFGSGTAININSAAII